MTADTPSRQQGIEQELRAAQRRVEAKRAEWRKAIDERNRLVWHAMDELGVGRNAVARALGLAGGDRVSKILAAGYPDEG